MEYNIGPMKHSNQHRGFLATIEKEAAKLRKAFASRPATPNRRVIATAIRAIREDWQASSLVTRRGFVNSHVAEVGGKAAFARALGLTRNRFRYLLGEG